MAAQTHQEPQQSGIPQPPDRAVRLPEVIKLIGRSKTMIYEDIRAGRFPAGFLVGKRARAWMLYADVMQWLESKKNGGAA